VTLFLLVLNALVLAIGFGMEYGVASGPPALVEINAAKIRNWTQPVAGQPDFPAANLADGTTLADSAGNLPEPGILCIDVTEPGQARYVELQALLKSAGFDDGRCAYSFDARLGWWVFWPPVYEPALRAKAIQAIQAAGVKDVLPIRQGAMAQAYSLGMFASEDQAIQHRDRLRGQGLAQVEYGPRPNVKTMRLTCRLEDVGRASGFLAGLPEWAKQVDAAECGPTNEVKTSR
jgi:hypothetical protein